MEEFEIARIVIYSLLAICSLLTVFVVVERLITLRQQNVIPKSLVERFVNGKICDDEAEELNTVGGRIVAFYRRNSPDPEALKAFAGLELTRLERGLFILEIVVAGAPLLGLLGTIIGLTEVFGSISSETGLPDTGRFLNGLKGALFTTMAGLAVAIPALVGNNFLGRRIELLSAQVEVGVQRLMDLCPQTGRPLSEMAAEASEESPEAAKAATEETTASVSKQRLRPA
ncbi:MAG: MotA/TolQ/ExbB proton channel family protein [Opitutales bacterium]